ncbi:MAG: lysophospholipid acyltransferase family protein [Desulfobacula sp.]|nr:lysophospholipid acyltransferase family protein [Desulfobacula sp.]MDA8133744.1 lysophospholipid acyltransferase family protein [Desulfobacteraceae bacterium]
MTPILLNHIILQPIFYIGAVVLLFLFGWKTQGRAPDIHRYVLIAAPHTSNWDFIFFLLIVFKLRLPVYWMGKDSMFRWPFKGILKRLGGIPVNRSEKNNVVSFMTKAFENSERLVITIAPSGARRNTGPWKTGFYHIAREAKVPIVCGFIDYQHKTIGIGPVFHPTGDMGADMDAIRAVYAPFSGRPSLSFTER